jgi:hypothetical protein
MCAPQHKGQCLEILGLYAILHTLPHVVECKHFDKHFTYLLIGFEHVALEDVAGAVSCDVTENLQVL